MSRNRGPGRSGDGLALLSFVAVLLLGLALIISFTLAQLNVLASFANYLRHISIAIVIGVGMFLSYREARRHTRVWFILWVIAVVVIIIFYFLGIDPFGWLKK